MVFGYNIREFRLVIHASDVEYNLHFFQIHPDDGVGAKEISNHKTTGQHVEPCQDSGAT
jgi:hypothetical protein